MSKMSEINKIILKVLSDGKHHSIAEIKQPIVATTILSEENLNLLYVTLNRLKKEDVIESPKKGIYKIKEKENMIGIFDAEKCREDLQDAWNASFEELMDSHQLSYTMSEQKFLEGKWLYSVNREIQKLISTFSLEDSPNE